MSFSRPSKSIVPARGHYLIPGEFVTVPGTRQSTSHAFAFGIE
jgi:hypothetical protein